MALAHENWILDLFGAMDETHRDQIYELLGVLKSSASRAAPKALPVRPA